MPFLSVRAVKGVMTDQDRERLIERLTDVVVDVIGGGHEEFRQHVWVVLEEIEPSHWGSGGKPANLHAIREMTGRE